MRIHAGILALVYGISLSLTVGAQEILPEVAPIPKDNPQTPERIELGRQFFFDPRLSRDGTKSCNSCHNVMAGGDDNRTLASGIGGRLGPRHSLSVWNSAFQSVHFWEGRADNLEDQVKAHLVDPLVMGMPDLKSVVERIKLIPGYHQQMKKVFGVKEPPTIDNIVKTIAAYERTLITPNGPFDLFLKGKKEALTNLQQKGFELFKNTGCVNCHNGVNFNGPALPAGMGFYQRFPAFAHADIEQKYNLSKDLGRFEHSKNEADKNLWRVPSLRNVALTAPYFHNGSVDTLQEAVRVMALTQLNKKLTKKEIEMLVAFLESLTGQFPSQPLPRLPDLLHRTVVESVITSP